MEEINGRKENAAQAIHSHLGNLLKLQCLGRLPVIGYTIGTRVLLCSCGSPVDKQKSIFIPFSFYLLQFPAIWWTNFEALLNIFYSFFLKYRKM